MHACMINMHMVFVFANLRYVACGVGPLDGSALRTVRFLLATCLVMMHAAFLQGSWLGNGTLSDTLSQFVRRDGPELDMICMTQKAAHTHTNTG